MEQTYGEISISQRVKENKIIGFSLMLTIVNKSFYLLTNYGICAMIYTYLDT